MQLKPRSQEPKYRNAHRDFESLAKKQQEYSDYFLSDHPIYPVQNFHLEKKRIEQLWTNKEITSATLTKETDLENLQIAFDQVKRREILERSVIKALFGRLYSYFEEMHSDYRIGYLSDENYEIYLLRFKTAIEQNKKLSTECWNQVPVDTIVKSIELTLKK